MEKNNKFKEKEERVEVGDYVIIDLTEIKSNITRQYSYQIVDNYVPDPRDDLNKVTTISPLGSNLILGKVGDTGEYKVHEYQYQYKILKIIKRVNEKISFNYNELNNNNKKTKVKKRIK